MGKVIKKYLIYAIIGGILYFFLSYHILIFGKDVKLLKKGKYTLEETFVNIGNIQSAEFIGPKDILKIKSLREDGVGQLLVDMEIITEEERWQMEDEIEAEEAEAEYQ